ncbi:MAG: exonuclease SbcCD subunit D [Lachnospiraceae bacterium]|nr:exonuclease SbcCD subunit D [Lachnospiraceae bacterium]
MKLLHLADLHLGKRVYEFSMIEDQKYILQQVLDIMDKEGIDGIIIAGDVYDKMVPSIEAVQLLDDFLSRISEKGIEIFLVSGNHDSAERLSFGAKIFSRNKIHLATGYQGKVEPILLEDAYGPISIYLLPFIKPAYVKHAFPERAEEIISYQDAMQVVVEQIPLDKTQRNVLVAHQFVTGASRCESEEISVGGVDNVDASLFMDFDYVALGHIHGPQWIGKETIRYAGTPLKYSFSECGHHKSVTLLELREKGNVDIRQIPFVPLHDMRKIKGTYEEVTARSFYENMDTKDYVHITLTDEEDIFDALGKLRVIYPNLMKLEYDNCRTRSKQEITAIEEAEQKSPLAMAKELFLLQNNKPMSEEQEILLADYIKKVWEVKA